MAAYATDIFGRRPTTFGDGETPLSPTINRSNTAASMPYATTIHHKQTLTAMTKRLLFTFIILYCCCTASAAGKRKNALLAVQPSESRRTNGTASNDSNTYLYDLMVDLITINGDKIKPSSKSSKPPSQSPVTTQVPSLVRVDDDNFLDDNILDDNPVNVPTFLTTLPNEIDELSIDEATSIPTASTTIGLPTSNPTMLVTTIAPSLHPSIESTLIPDSSPSPSIIEISIPTYNTTTVLSTAPNTTPSIDATLYPTSNVIATSKYSYDDDGAFSRPSASPTDSSIPTKSKASKAPVTTEVSISECPKQFNSSTEYHEFDMVSMRSIIYKCKKWPEDAYCNTFEPGSKYSDHGWIVEGPCITPTPTLSPAVREKETNQLLNSIAPTESPTFDEDTATYSPTDGVHSVTISTTLIATSNNSADETSADTEDEDVLSVGLPRIICDISFSQNLAHKFEDKHILLVAMSNTIFSILDTHLSTDIAGIFLSVQVSINSSGNETAAAMHRLKADFTGNVSFSFDDDAPSEEELVHLLLSHFSIEEFTKRLESPLMTLRAASTQDQIVKVNSVFFFDNDMLLPVGATSSHEGSLTSTKGETTIESANLQLAVSVFVLTAVGFALAMILFVAHSKRIDFYYEDDTVLPQPTTSSNQAVAATTPKNDVSDPEVEVSTRKRNPYFGGIDSLSDISSLSESPYTDRSISVQDIAPATPSLGIVAPNHRYIACARTPYTDDYSLNGEKEWRMRSCMLETP